VRRIEPTMAPIAQIHDTPQSGICCSTGAEGYAGMTGRIPAEEAEEREEDSCEEEEEEDTGSSILQRAEQPSSSVTFPSSHCSGSSMIPSPQTGEGGASAGCSRVQKTEQPSPYMMLPSSHCSPASRKPLPQRTLAAELADDKAESAAVGMGVQRQSAAQKEPDSHGRPRSHCSPGSRTPSPQAASGIEDAEKDDSEEVTEEAERAASSADSDEREEDCAVTPGSRMH